MTVQFASGRSRYPASGSSLRRRTWHLHELRPRCGYLWCADRLQYLVCQRDPALSVSCRVDIVTAHKLNDTL